MTFLFAFLAGVATIASPCVLPLLPVILASSTLEGRFRAAGLILGFALFFTGITLALSLLVRHFAVSPDIHRIAAGTIFVAMGAVLTLPVLKHRFEYAASGVIGSLDLGPRRTTGFLGGMLTGAGLGLAWTPCVGPIMASVITLALNQETTAQSALTAAFFSLGTALPMGLAVVFGKRLYDRTNWLKRHSSRLQQAMGLCILLVGLAILLGADRTVQVWLLTWFPGWDQALTGWERAVTD